MLEKALDWKSHPKRGGVTPLIVVGDAHSDLTYHVHFVRVRVTDAAHDLVLTNAFVAAVCQDSAQISQAPPAEVRTNIATVDPWLPGYLSTCLPVRVPGGWRPHPQNHFVVGRAGEGDPV